MSRVLRLGKILYKISNLYSILNEISRFLGIFQDFQGVYKYIYHSSIITYFAAKLTVRSSCVKTLKLISNAVDIRNLARTDIKISCPSRGRLYNVPARNFLAALNSLRATLYYT